MEKHIHIVSLDVPYPPDYGGVVDLYYKLKYLHEKGIIIHLHCYEYGRGKQEALLEYCKTVHYYKRSAGWLRFLTGLPYIAGSRAGRELSGSLANDNYPVLLEGIHCTFLLYRGKLAGRKVILRLHNIESEYYRQLAHHSASLFRKIYYRAESILLKRYERKVVPKADLVVTVTEKDAQQCRTDWGVENAVYLPVFTPWNVVTCREGSGTYCLYQGNLSVSENERAVLWLVKNVFSGLSIPLVIAGKHPSLFLQKEVKKYSHIRMVANPSQEQMQQLIEEAQVNLLPSFTRTGIKLKLLHAVFCGRHCVVNSAMAEGSHLEAACFIAEDAAAFRDAVQLLFHRPFSTEDQYHRQHLLAHYFNNRHHAGEMVQWIWNRDV